MSATLLQIVQRAIAELGIEATAPAVVIGNSVRTVIQMLALANAVGNELERQYQWQALNTEYRVTTSYTATTGTTTSASAVVTAIPSTTGLDATYAVIGEGVNPDTYILSVDSATQVTLSQAATASGTGVTLNFCKTKYSYPSDYDRPIDRTQWDKSKHWEMQGPETAQQWQWLKSGYISTGPRLRFRPLGGYFQIFPPTASNEYIGFEYVSNAWVIPASGANKTSFTVDTDTCIFPDRLMVQGLKLKYFEVKGFDTTALYRDYMSQLDIAKANDSGSQTLSFAPDMGSPLIGWDNIPDSGFGA